MVIRSLIAASALLPCLFGAVAARPQHVVSTNLCADQYLIALADRGQVAGLSEYARDPSLSFYYERARDYPIVRSSAEAILPLKPDLIVGSPTRRLQTRALLRRFGLPVVDVGLARNFDDIAAQTRAIASAIGYPKRGEALIAAMRAQLAAIAAPRTARPLIAVHYQRQGYVTGTDTLMDDMMARAGLRNLAGTLGDKQLAHVDLEAIVSAKPDYIIFTHDPSNVRDWGAMLLRHPALVHAFAGRGLYIPDNLTVCGGPSYPVAVARLAEQIRSHPVK